MQHSDLSKSKVTCIVANWTLHRHPIDQEAFKKTMGAGWKEGMLPMLITGEVVQDFALRWQPGQSMTSTVLFEVDFFSMRIRTRNSVYQLDGPGIVLPRMPKVMEYDVGNATIALAIYKGGVQGVVDQALTSKDETNKFDSANTTSSKSKGESHE